MIPETGSSNQDEKSYRLTILPGINYKQCDHR